MLRQSGIVLVRLGIIGACAFSSAGCVIEDEGESVASRSQAGTVADALYYANLVQQTVVSYANLANATVNATADYAAAQVIPAVDFAAGTATANANAAQTLALNLANYIQSQVPVIFANVQIVQSAVTQNAGTVVVTVTYYANYAQSAGLAEVSTIQATVVPAADYAVVQVTANAELVLFTVLSQL